VQSVTSLAKPTKSLTALERQIQKKERRIKGATKKKCYFLKIKPYSPWLIPVVHLAYSIVLRGLKGAES